MTSTTAISLPRFLPLRSFLAYAVGDERIEVRDGAVAPSAGAVEQRKAA
jgi:hypothetical protein